MSAMLSTLPAMGTLMGCLGYMTANRFSNTAESGLSSYILISCAMMPCSFSTLSGVKYGVVTMRSRILRFSANSSVHST